MAREVSTYEYPFEAVRADYLRAGLGFTMCFLPLVEFELVPWIAVVLAVLSTMFAIYGLRTAAHQATRLTVTDEAILSSGWRRVRLVWDEISGISLAYYSTRREAGTGWMQLRLAGRGATLRIESTLVGFPEIARRASRAATANGVTLDRTTTSNLHALGVAVPEVVAP